jgi:hypothetical protein
LYWARVHYAEIKSSLEKPDKDIAPAVLQASTTISEKSGPSEVGGRCMPSALAHSLNFSLEIQISKSVLVHA